jgi:hypothetical protein
MIENVRCRFTLVLPVLLLSVSLLGACGNSNKKSTSPATAEGLDQASIVGMNRCTNCHTTVTADWLLSRHANAEGGLDDEGAPATGYFGHQPPTDCTICHDQLGDSSVLVQGYTGNVSRPVTGCESCHGPGSLHADAGGAGPISRVSGSYTLASYSLGTTVVSGQFVMCTNCHQLLDMTGAQSSLLPHGTHSTMDQVIWDTHYAAPGDYPGGSKRYVNQADITGYTMDFSSERVCIDCHDPHGTADINKEWAQSKHAEKSAGGAWGHYNWSCDGSDDSLTGGCGGSDRRGCQRCHTTSGYVAFVDALRMGDTATAESILSGTASPAPVAYSAGFSPEMLKCTGCHTDNLDILRDPGAYTANYDYVSGDTIVSAASHAYPDASSSNVCMPCHTSTQSGDTVKNLLLSTPEITTFGDLGFINSHYLPAGGTVFKGTGYEFARSYANPASYIHDKVGTAIVPNTGTGGPCVGCHMYQSDTSASHLFRPVGKDNNGAVTSIVSEVCYHCHAGSSSSLAEIAEEEREKFEASLHALINQLDKKGISFRGAYPYMFKQRTSSGLVTLTTGSDIVTGSSTSFVTAGTVTSRQPDWFRAEVDATIYSIASVNSDTQITLKSVYTGPTITGGAYVIMRGTAGDAAKDWLAGGSEVAGRNNLGAAFNLQLLEHEPGAYIHNRAYTQRLIYDSLDWLDDDALNYSVGNTLDTLPAETSYKTDAMLYLLPSGVLTGIAAERP